jgi:hypothetical protein
LDAQDVEYAADLVEKAALNVLMRSEMTTVSNWLKALPETVLFSRPRLCVLSAGVMAFTGQMQAVEPLLHKAESQAPLDARDPASRDLLGQVRLIRAFRLVFEGDLPGAAHLARESLEYLPEGDSMARRVIEWAGRELGSLATGVIRQLDLESLDFDVVLVGSLYDGRTLLADAMQQTVHAIAPGARFVRLTAPPVVGGVLLGMEQVSLNGRAFRERLIETTKVLLNSSAAPLLAG